MLGYSQERDVSLEVPLPGGAKLGAETIIKSSTSSDDTSQAEQGDTKTFRVD